MMRLIKISFFLLLFLIWTVSTISRSNQLASAYETQSTTLGYASKVQKNVDSLTELSVLFIENVGQFPARAKYQVRGGRQTIWLADDAIWVTFLTPYDKQAFEEHLNSEVSGQPNAQHNLKEPKWEGVNIRLSFIGANLKPELQAFSPVTTTVSYFKGNKPDAWHTDVPVFEGVRYVDLYPGLDLEMIQMNNAVQTRLVCRLEDCDAALVPLKLQIEGAESLALDDGRLMIYTDVGEFTLPLFTVIDAGGNSLPLHGQNPTVKSNIITMPLAASPQKQGHQQTYIPDDDPTDLLYSTYLGGNAEDYAYGITVDDAGNAYVTGWTTSVFFPTTPGSFDTSYSGVSDGFVTKLNAAGTSLVYSTFLGGTESDLIYGGSIEVDNAGNVYVTGSTDSNDFPATSGAFDTSYNGNRDGFVTKLNAAGNALVYSTFLGGSNFDAIYGDIAIDGAGNAYVTGSTNSADFPTTPGAFDTSYNGNRDGFVTKLNPTGSSLVYSTFLGGSELDSIYGGIDVNDAGSAYVTASTNSADFPTTPGAFDTSYNGMRDVFVTKLNPTGSALIYSTFLGGADSDFVNGGGGIAVDNDGIVHVAGSTDSADFPTTPGAFDTSFNGSTDIYVTKLNSTGTALVFSTFLGGTDFDSVFGGITIDSDGNTYLTGQTGSAGFPTTPNAYDTIFNGTRDAFVSILSITGNSMIYSTFLGGSAGESGGGSITVDSDGNAYVAGFTSSGVFPTTPGAFDPSFNGGFDVFIAKLMTSVSADFSALPTEGVSPLSVQFVNESTGNFDTCFWDFGDGVGSSNSCSDPSYTYQMTGTFTVSLSISGSVGNSTLVQPNLVSVSEAGAVNFTGSPINGTSPLTVTFQNLSTGNFDTCLWDFGDGIGTSTDCSAPVYTYTTPGTYSVTLAVSGPNGSDSLTRPNFINVSVPTAAEFSGTPTIGIALLAVTFTNLSIGDFSTCLWTFGDGSTSDSCFAPTHVYSTDGVYTVSLSVSGVGSNSTTTKLNYITVHAPVVADFSANPTSGTAPHSVSFTNLSTGDFDSCHWDYGDGESSDQCEQHTHVYETNGLFTVSLTISGPGGTDTMVQTDLISVGASIFKIYLPVTLKMD